MQKEHKSRDIRLQRFWCLPKDISTGSSGSCNRAFASKRSNGGQCFQHLHYFGLSQIAPKRKTTCSLPLLQIWPSQDSQCDKADGQSLHFADISGRNLDTDREKSISPPPINDLDNSNSNDLGLEKTFAANDCFYSDTLHAGDSGIESMQLSPSPNARPPSPVFKRTSKQKKENEGNHSFSRRPKNASTNFINQVSSDYKQERSVSFEAGNQRRQSSSLLHPDHARLFGLRLKYIAKLEISQTSPDQTSTEDAFEFRSNDIATNSNIYSASSSMNSSLTSVAAVSMGGETSKPTLSMTTVDTSGILDNASEKHQSPEAWMQQNQLESENDTHYKRNRSYSKCTRCSLFDALDLEYALLSTTARGSVGPFSLSESIHKLTFTQSLAFPALARGLASKHRRSATKISSRPLHPNESGLSICAKVITAAILVAISFIVFLIVYKFVHT